MPYFTLNKKILPYPYMDVKCGLSPYLRMFEVLCVIMGPNRGDKWSDRENYIMKDLIISTQQMLLG